MTDDTPPTGVAIPRPFRREPVKQDVLVTAVSAEPTPEPLPPAEPSDPAELNPTLVDLFRLINALPPGGGVSVGDKVKIISE